MTNFSKIINEKKLKEIYKSTVDFMLASDMFSNDARLFYPPIKIDCPSCSNSTSFGCLNCDGNGFLEEVTSEIIRLRVHFSGRSSFNSQAYRKLGINIQDATGEVLTLGYMADIPKVMSANYIEFFEDQEYQTYKFKLSSPPAPYGFCRHDYYYAMWEKDDNA